jgi:hypothetical protein
MNPRLLSYRPKLVQYTEMVVIWTEGKSHLIADALSRSLIFDPPEDSGDHMALCYGVQSKDPLLHAIYNAAIADPICNCDKKKENWSLNYRRDTQARFTKVFGTKFPF